MESFLLQLHSKKSQFYQRRLLHGYNPWINFCDSSDQSMKTTCGRLILRGWSKELTGIPDKNSELLNSTRIIKDKKVFVL